MPSNYAPNISAKPLAIALMGPTAAGKTDLAIGLCKALNAELISADSALVYRGMDIGTAKPSAAEQAAAPHRLIDIRDPADPYSAADFARDASAQMSAIVAANKTPLVVGGTMLYFKALLEGLAPMPAADLSARAAIEALAAREGWPFVHRELADVDPKTAAKLHPNHSQRICRALEVFRATGKPMSWWQGQQTQGLDNHYHWVQLAIAPSKRSVLHQRIALRFDAMLEQGFVDEVRHLYQRGDLHLGLASMKAVGYRQVWEYLAGANSYSEMREKGIAATRQLAKRQLTWLRSWHDLSWINSLGKDELPLSSDEILIKALNVVGAAAI